MSIYPPSHSSSFPSFFCIFSIFFTYPLLLLSSPSPFLSSPPHCIIERGRKQPQVLSCRHPKVLIILQSRGDHPSSAGSQTGECKGFLFSILYNITFLCEQPSHCAIKGNNILGAMHIPTHTPFLKPQLMRRIIQPAAHQSFASKNILYCITECVFALPHQLLYHSNKSFCAVLEIKVPLLF